MDNLSILIIMNKNQALSVLKRILLCLVVGIFVASLQTNKNSGDVLIKTLVGTIGANLGMSFLDFK